MWDWTVFLLLERLPEEVWMGMRCQVSTDHFAGLDRTSLYEFFACPACVRWPEFYGSFGTFLAVSTVINIGAGSFGFVAVLVHGYWGVSSYLLLPSIFRVLASPDLFSSLQLSQQVIPKESELKWDGGILKRSSICSSMTCIQQSVMNFPVSSWSRDFENILVQWLWRLLQRRWRIDSCLSTRFQDFGSAYSTFYRPKLWGRKIKNGIKRQGNRAFAFKSFYFTFISALVFIFAGQLMKASSWGGEKTGYYLRYLNICG